jgi:hypothetical protein
VAGVEVDEISPADFTALEPVPDGLRDDRRAPLVGPLDAMASRDPGGKSTLPQNRIAAIPIASKIPPSITLALELSVGDSPRITTLHRAKLPATRHHAMRNY